MNKMNEETRVPCPMCRPGEGSIDPNHPELGCMNVDCQNYRGTPKKSVNGPSNFDKRMFNARNGLGETSMGALGGQALLPLGASSSAKKKLKEFFDLMIKEAGDINEAQTVVFLRSLSPAQIVEVVSAFELGNFDFVAGLVREHVIREAVRVKIQEVVRKKKGGGGFTLYAPNPHKKHKSHPVQTFPTKLAAKRANLARFPPKDPKKLQRLRREIARLMKDPKKAADVERRAATQKGTDTPHSLNSPTKPKAPKKARKFENLIISKIIVNEMKKRIVGGVVSINEAAEQSEWDEFMNKVSDRAVKGDAGFQQLMTGINSELGKLLAQALQVIQQQLGANIKVQSLGMKQGDSHSTNMAFKINTDSAEVGPIFVAAVGGNPKIELSDEAQGAFANIEPETVEAIRKALSTAESTLASTGALAGLVSKRDEYLNNLQNQADQVVSGMSPMQLSILKQLLVKKYRGTRS